MAQKGLWKFAGENVLQDRGQCSKEEGDVDREYKAMHEENFLSSWLREDGENKGEISGEVGKETEEETGKKRIREEDREENETVIVKSRCINSVSTEAFEIFSQGEMSESGVIGTSGPVVLVVTDALVSPSSVVTEVCDGFSLGSDGELVEPQSFSFSRKRAHSWTVTQKEMRYKSSSARTPPPSRRRMMPLTHSLCEERQCQIEVRIRFGVRATERLLQKLSSTWKKVIA